MNPLLTKILFELRGHVGQEQIISGRDLGRAAGITQRNPDRVVRSILEDALYDGTLEELEVPLCAVMGQGYFLANDIEECRTYCAFQDGVVDRALMKAKAVRQLFNALGLYIPGRKKL